jgi:hypothetical protein
MKKNIKFFATDDSDTDEFIDIIGKDLNCIRAKTSSSANINATNNFIKYVGSNTNVFSTLNNGLINTAELSDKEINFSFNVHNLTIGDHKYSSITFAQYPSGHSKGWYMYTDSDFIDYPYIYYSLSGVASCNERTANAPKIDGNDVGNGVITTLPYSNKPHYNIAIGQPQNPFSRCIDMTEIECRSLCKSKSPLSNI